MTALSKPIEDVTVEDIESFRKARQNTCEPNQPFNVKGDWMDILLEGSHMLVQEFRDSDENKMYLGGAGPLTASSIAL